MSVQAITLALALRDVSSSEKLVAIVLANYADEKGRAWPSQKTISEQTCLTPRTVRAALVSLCDRGIIEREERLRQDGSRSTDLITFTWGAEAVSGGGEMVSGGGGKPLPGGGEIASALTTFEPSTDPSEEKVEGASAPAKPKASRRCPDGWDPPVAVLKTLAIEGFTAGEMERELAKFRDHQFRTALTDWSAAYRNWIRKSRDFKPHDRPSPDDRRTARNRVWADIADEERGQGTRLLAGAG
ncbi:helix-turn-helix domain-containing protein [Phenylobacterium sp.]|uniref:helix-turn-helix domain-containing protein n=1 Tax=Phenylobacterium sp. TaxID=1871053 RepID=UPI0026083D42|nr:helix-turn-helix domain-containing protein [Phenylobacterium sp.]